MDMYIFSPSYMGIPLSCVDLGALVNAGVFRAYHRIKYGGRNSDFDESKFLF